MFRQQVDKWRQTPLRLQTILCIFLCMVVLCITFVAGYGSFRLFSAQMITQLANSRIDLLGQISGKLNSLGSIVLSFSDLYFFNDSFGESVRPDGPLTRSEAVSRQLDGLNDLYDKALVTNGLQLEYTMLTEDYSYHSRFKDRQINMNQYNLVLWRYDFLQGNSNAAWIPTYRDLWHDSADVFSLARAITDKDRSTIGYFLVNASEEILHKTYEQSLNSENSIYIINADGKIVSHNDKSMIGFYFYRMDRLNELFGQGDFTIITKNRQQYLLSRFQNPGFGWTILEEIPLPVVLAPLYRLRTAIILICISLALVGCLLALFLAKRIAVPIKHLCADLKQVAVSEDNAVHFHTRSWRELGEISNECNYMNHRITTLVQNVKSTEAQIREAELKFLYAQINPHFMHNTLFTLKCLIGMNRIAEAEQMVTEFSTLLGIVLQPSAQLIPIEQEMYILTRYIHVQKFRYGEQINVRIDCADELLGCLMPKLLLQPLVENAIFHGFKGNFKDASIQIRVSSDSGHLFIAIEDNGSGFNSSAFDLSEQPSSQIDMDSRTEAGNHIGIRNVHNRIQLIYGEAYGLRIESAVGSGTRITIDIPYSVKLNV